MNILFIGNSYTYYNDMPALFQALARENGRDVSVCAVTKGGRKLSKYADPDDPVTAELEQRLAEGRYDVCIVQEQSQMPVLDYDRYLQGLTLVADKARPRADRLILYATWGRKAGSPQLAEMGMTTRTMALGLDQACRRAAQAVGAEVSPVGSRFLTVYETHPELELYDPDLSHPSRLGSCLAAVTHYHTVFGQLPQHWDSLGLTPEQWAVFQAAAEQ